MFFIFLGLKFITMRHPVFFLFCLLHLASCRAPETLQLNLPLSKYGLPVVNDIGIYKKIVQANGENKLLDMRALTPDAQFDVTYATPNNLIKRAVYQTAEVFMRRPAALALQSVHQTLKQQGYGLVLFDGYRPYRVTEIFYEEIKDTTYVADPKRGSRHNRGMAIDLSLFDLKTGKRVSMPSNYDETTPRAFHSFMDSDSASLKHREILKNAMTAVGFEINLNEWWHYDFKGYRTCYTYDLWHADIKKANEGL